MKLHDLKCASPKNKKKSINHEKHFNSPDSTSIPQKTIIKNKIQKDTYESSHYPVDNQIKKIEKDTYAARHPADNQIGNVYGYSRITSKSSGVCSIPVAQLLFGKTVYKVSSRS